MSADCFVDDLTVAYKDQESFLSNCGNKSRFLELLIARLRSHGYKVMQAVDVDDADTDIVKTALQIARCGR